MQVRIPSENEWLYIYFWTGPNERNRTKGINFGPNLRLF